MTELRSQRAPSAPFGQTTGPVGIGGWLLLLAIAHVITPIQLLIGGLGMLRRFLSPEGTEAMRTAWESSPPLGLALVIATFGPLLLASGGVYVLILLVRQSRRFPAAFVVLSVASLVLAGAVVAMAMTAPEYRAQPGTPGRLLRAGLGALSTLVWVAYVKASTRVANTFVED